MGEYKGDRRHSPRGADRRREPRAGASLEARLVLSAAFLDADETFSVTLARATGGGLDGPSTAVVTITDNDAPPSAAGPSRSSP